MNSKIEQLKKNQKKIELFFEKSKQEPVEGSEIRQWIIDSVTHFTELDMNPNIMDLFIGRCEYREENNGRHSHGIFKYKFLRGYSLKGRNKSDDISPFITPVQVALSISRMLVDKYEEEERIIPKSLIDLFNNEKIQAIKLALEGVESNYQTKDARGMMGPLITATELICRLIPELQGKKKISDCLNKLYSNKDLCAKYNLNNEIVWALNNARIIRNSEVLHTKLGHKGDVSIYEAVGYAHLLVLLTDSFLASGQCKLEE